MRILGVETSCDETACAIVEDGIKILSNVVASSADMHTKTGGIIPENAARQQIKSIIPVISESLKITFVGSSIISHQSSDKLNTKPKTKNSKLATSYQLSATNIDAIAVTVGPGLIGSLLVGVETAKTLSYLWEKPIIPVNHLVAHIYANWLTPTAVDCKPKAVDFPVIALVVSGGHTDLVLMKNHGKIKYLGGTRDDAGGEAFDKCARLLGLPYPGGPSISKEAEKFLNRSPKSEVRSLNLFPRPMIDSKSLDFSFSGLKTSVLREVEKRKGKNQFNSSTVQQFSAEIQEAIIDCLIKKSQLAVKKYHPKSFLLAGGVASNKTLREKLPTMLELEKLKVYFHVPPPVLCTDNATYIASCAYFNYNPVHWNKVAANPQLTIADNSI